VRERPASPKGKFCEDAVYAFRGICSAWGSKKIFMAGFLSTVCAAGGVLASAYAGWSVTSTEDAMFICLGNDCQTGVGYAPFRGLAGSKGSGAGCTIGSWVRTVSIGCKESAMVGGTL
jgi:hypothetical protein